MTTNCLFGMQPELKYLNTGLNHIKQQLRHLHGLLINMVS